MSSRLKSALVIFAILVISIWSVWPVIRDIKTAVSDSGDSILIVWILNQTIKKIPNNLGNIFQGNIFYPYKNVMAYSELLIPSAILSYIPVKILGEPAVAFGWTLIFGQIATMLVIYFWWFDLSKDRTSSLIATLALGLSQIRMHYTSQLQMWGMQWWLISVFLLYKFLKSKKIWQLYLAGVFFAIQAWESILPLFFILFIGLALIIFFKGWNVIWKERMHLLIMGSIIFLVIFPVIYAYFSVSNQFHYVRPIREVAHFSMSLNDIWQRFLSPGLYFLSAVAFVSLKKGKKTGTREALFLLAIFLGGIIMSLGPILKWQDATVKIFGKVFIPLPYGVLYYILPGFKALRTPLRWYWISAWALSGVIALGLKEIKFKTKNFIVFIFFLIAIFWGTKEVSIYQLPLKKDYPPVYSWLKNQDSKNIIELPMYTWGDGDLITNELLRMIYSLYTGKNLVNGYSGFYPPSREELIKDSQIEFPEGRFLSELKNLDINLVVIHKDEYDKENLDEILELFKDKIVWENGNTSVLKI